MYFWPFALPQADERNPFAPVTDEADPDSRLAAGGDPTGELPPALVGFLRAMLPGRRILLPSDGKAYDDASKTYNPRFYGLKPGGIVFCTDEQDVRICLQGVTCHDVPFRVRAGGHTFAGFSSLQGGLILDVSAMTNLTVDAAALTATAQAGCTMGTLGRALNSAGLQLPLGGNPVAVGGFVQGGGFGETSRSFGIQSDNVLEARVMLADGRTVTANERINHDLWWAIRGGTGGNFGVLLDVSYALHRVPAPQQWQISWPIRSPADRARAALALTTMQDAVMHDAGPELSASADIRYWADTSGGTSKTLRLLLWGSFFGSALDMEARVRPLTDITGAERFTQIGSTTPLQVLRQARFVTELPVADWRTLVDDFADHANIASTLTLSAWGGAISTYPRERSAFIHRDAAFNIYVTGFWNGPAEEQRMRAYLQRWRDFIEPFWTGGVYQDFADAELPDFQYHYWGDAFPALLEVKRKYDPDCLFDFEQAITAGPIPPRPATWPPTVVAWLAKPIET